MMTRMSIAAVILATFFLAPAPARAKPSRATRDLLLFQAQGRVCTLGLDRP
jgi:hypothetical protein